MLINTRRTTEHVLAAFSEGIAARGGEVTDVLHSRRYLFARSVLPLVEEVQPGDELQGGVALKAAAQDVWLFPYLFRAVCENGAIIVERLEKQSLGNLLVLESDPAACAVREGIEACSSPKVFTDIISQVRASCDVEVVDEEIAVYFALIPWLRPNSEPESNSALFSKIVDRFEREADSSRYGLANAFTSVARDTRAHELRWDLEELGGAIAIGKVPSLPTRGGQQAVALPELMPVG